jgi:hypothetical protein
VGKDVMRQRLLSSQEVWSGALHLPAVRARAASWQGLFVPRGTPRDIIGKLNAAAMEALADPAVRSRLAGLGVEVFPRDRQTPEALAALVKTDAEKWWPFIGPDMYHVDLAT